MRIFRAENQRLHGKTAAVKNAGSRWRSSAEPPRKMDQLNQDFLESIGLLEEEKVESLLGNANAREDFLIRDHLVEIGREPRKIQVLTGIDSVQFKDCAIRKVKQPIGGILVKFIGKEDMMMTKAASGRPKAGLQTKKLASSAGSTSRCSRRGRRSRSLPCRCRRHRSWWTISRWEFPR